MVSFHHQREVYGIKNSNMDLFSIEIFLDYLLVTVNQQFDAYSFLFVLITSCFITSYNISVKEIIVNPSIDVFAMINPVSIRNKLNQIHFHIYIRKSFRLFYRLRVHLTLTIYITYICIYQIVIKYYILLLNNIITTYKLLYINEKKKN